MRLAGLIRMIPRSDSIAAALASLAGTYWPIAVAWHMAFLLAFVAVARGWRPGRSRSARLLVLPLISVAVLAALSGNPFNAGVFLLTAASLGYVTRKTDRDPIAFGQPWQRAIGGALLAFGWVYPHFLEPRPPAWYLFAAPVGIVPCPTLAMTIGATLVLGGLGARRWSVILGAVGMFYGLFGTLRLGVMLDVGLIAGAAALLGLALRTHRPGATGVLTSRRIEATR